MENLYYTLQYREQIHLARLRAAADPEYGRRLDASQAKASAEVERQVAEERNFLSSEAVLFRQLVEDGLVDEKAIVRP